MSRVLPILFNTDMVRAILEGRKTVTRRVMKLQPTGKVMHLTGYKTDEWGEEKETATGGKYFSRFKLPYQPGDILYVRETWCWEPCWDCGMDTEEHNCGDESANKFFNHDKGEWGCYGYKASLEDNVYPSVDVWHPSIHMPKEAARIWLKVTDVSVEHLQEMTASESTKEGIRLPVEYYTKERAYILAFADLWDSTIKKSDLDRYGWDANPWVWVIEFERCEKPELLDESK